MKRIALIAGQGKLPIVFADEARRDGAYVIGIGINGISPPEIEAHVDKAYWGDLTETKRALETFRKEKVNYIAMTGKIPKSVIYTKTGQAY